MDQFHQAFQPDDKPAHGNDAHALNPAHPIDPSNPPLSQRVNMLLNEEPPEELKNEEVDENEEGTTVNNKPLTVQSNTATVKHRDEEDYQRLKKKFKALREEYLKVLEGWENAQEKVKSLAKERKYLKDKLEQFMIPPPKAQRDQGTVQEEPNTKSVQTSERQQQPDVLKNLQQMQQQNNYMHQQQVYAVPKEQKRRKKDMIAPSQQQPLQNQMQANYGHQQAQFQTNTSQFQTGTNIRVANFQNEVNLPHQPIKQAQTQQQYFQREQQQAANYDQNNFVFRQTGTFQNPPQQIQQQVSTNNGIQFQGQIQDTYASQNFQRVSGSLVNDTGFDSNIGDQRYSSNDLFTTAPSQKQISQLSPRYFSNQMDQQIAATFQQQQQQALQQQARSNPPPQY